MSRNTPSPQAAGTNRARSTARRGARPCFSHAMMNHGRSTSRRPFGVGLAMLLFLGIVWQPVTAFGAPVAPDTAALTVDSPQNAQEVPQNAHLDRVAIGDPVQTIRNVDATMAISATTTVINSDAPDPSTVNQGYTVNATVSTAVGTPTGTVNVSDGTGPTCSFTVPPATGSCVLTSLTAGVKTLTANYLGDATFFPSSDTEAHLVNKASTSVAVTSATNPAERTVSVVFTATITEIPSGAANPSGTVNFFDGVTFIGSGPVGGSNTATFATSSLSVGSHSITAQYLGDANFDGSTSPAITQTITKTPTSTSLATSPNPSMFGEYVVLTATVSNTGAPSGGTPDGLVNFKDGIIPIGSGFVDGSGVAAIAVCNLTVGSHSLTAAYGGSSNFLASTSGAVSQTVNKDNTSTTVTSSTNPTVFGQIATFNASVVGVSPCSGTPTGTVTFKDGGTTLSTQSLLSGSASFSIHTLPVGGHSITAEYNGDAQHNTSTSSAVTHTVNKANTTTTLTSTTNPTVYGETITLSAGVSANAPGSGVPSGTVVFKDITGAPVTLCTVGPSSGAFSCIVTVPPMPVGSRILRADYSGDASYNASNSATLTQVVNKANTTTAIAQSNNPSVFGQTTSFTATVSAVAPGSGMRTGTIQFQVDAVNVGGPIALNASFQASLSTAALSVGAHSVTGIYSGDSNFNGSTSASLSHTVNKANTTTTLISAPNPSANGQNVLITATVAPVAPGAGLPTGTVTFKDGPTTIGTGPLDGAGVATMNTTAFTVGAHLLTAVYSGDGNFNTSTSAPYNHNVGVASTTTALTQDSAATVYGQAVLFTATVSGSSGTPTGVVTFKDGATAIGTGTLNGAGVATLSYSLLDVGAHPSITAVYNGSGGYSASTSPAVSHTVSQASTTTTVVSSVNPSVKGQLVTFTATVSPTPPGGGVPSGTVTFKDGVTTIGTGPLNGSGQATFSTNALSVGAHTINAEYPGSTNHAASSGSVGQTVNKANTTTALSAAPNPSGVGQNVNFTATVAPVAPGTGTPTGSVDFKDGGVTIGSGVLNGAGQATFSTSGLSLGSHTMTAVYTGDANYNTSTSPAVTQVVNAVASNIDLSVTQGDTPDPLLAGNSVTYYVTVTNNSALSSGVTLTDTLPTSAGSFVSFSAPGWSCVTPPGQIVCTLASLAGGASASISVVWSTLPTTPAGTVLVNGATVSGGGTDPNPGNNTYNATTTVYRSRRP